MHDTPEDAAALFAASGMTLSKPIAEYSATAPSFPKAVQAHAAPQPRSDSPSTRHAALLAALDTAHGAANPAVGAAAAGAFMSRKPRTTPGQAPAHSVQEDTPPDSPHSAGDELYDDDADAVDAAWVAQQKSVQGMAVCCASCFTTVCRSCIQRGKRFFTARGAVILADVTMSGTLVCPGCASVVGHVQQCDAGPTYALQEVAPLYST